MTGLFFERLQTYPSPCPRKHRAHHFLSSSNPGFPDPFAVATVNGEQTKTTSVIKKTLNPYWNERFDLRVNEDSVLAVQIFDQKKFKKKDQGFLGVVNIRIGNVIDLDAGGDGMSCPESTSPYLCSATTYIYSC